MALSSLSDAELWTLIVNDDYRAFTALYQRYWKKLFRTAIKYLHDDEATEEVVHDLFLNIWNKRGSLVINNFESYFTAATRYQVFAYQKKHKETPIVYLENFTEREGKSELNTAEVEMTYYELECRLNSHLRSLPVKCKEIFLLSRVDHFSNSEIAHKLGIDKRTVENRLSQALQSIRLNMKDILFLAILISVVAAW